MSATKQINVRLPLDLHKLLDDHKVKTGEDKARVIIRGIGLALEHPSDTGDTEQEAADRPAASPGSPYAPKVPYVPTPDSVETAAWISGRMGIPRALARRRLSEGRVVVGGEVYREERLEKDRLGEVEVDGRKLRHP